MDSSTFCGPSESKDGLQQRHHKKSSSWLSYSHEIISERKGIRPYMLSRNALYCLAFSLILCASVGFAQSPPFTQCPSIGLSPSCAVLIVVNPNGSLKALTDPSIPPFDGIEDTLVGVQNNSGATIFGISLTGPGIFDFDGDGAGPNGSYAGPGT